MRLPRTRLVATSLGLFLAALGIGLPTAFPAVLGWDEVEGPSAPPVAEAPPLLWVLGDSYTGHGYGGDGANGWPSLVAADLGMEVANSAVAGSGYVNYHAGSTFPYAAAASPARAADVAVVFGSVNDSSDSPAAVHLAATTTFALIRAASPDVELIVVGPQWTQGPAEPWNEAGRSRLIAIRDAIRLAAEGAGAVFVDALPWFDGRADLMGWSDHLHPNEAGQALIAEHVRPLVEAALSRATATPSPVAP
jgi:lysophospholipase L1-like esterase